MTLYQSIARLNERWLCTRNALYLSRRVCQHRTALELRWSVSFAGYVPMYLFKEGGMGT